MPKKQELSEQEWSHFIDVEDVDIKPYRLSIEASGEEREDMARRLNVEAVKSASADLTLEREQGGHVIRVFGRFTAVVTQNCVVTLEAFDTELSEKLEGWFGDQDSAVSFAAAKRERDVAKSQAEVEILPEHEDPETVIDGRIDLGELVTQHISLSIPAYPHKDGVAYEYGDDQPQIDENSPLRKNPFEALKDWKEKR